MPTSRSSSFFARRPLTGVDKLTAVALALSAFWSGLFALFPGGRGGPLPYFFVALLLATVLVALGIRWAPAVGALVAVVLFISMFTITGYVIYHLTQPREQFAIYIVDLLFLASVLAAIGLGVYATARHYASNLGQSSPAPLLTPIFTGLAGILLGAILIGAIVQAPTTVTSTNGEPVVHLGPASFAPDLVAVPRGAKLLVVDDATITHILANGAWDQGHASVQAEPGAPAVNQVHIATGSTEIGPFTASGTYHILCLVHPGMNLTVVVP